VVSLFVGLVVARFSELYEKKIGERVDAVHRRWIRLYGQIVKQKPPRKQEPAASSGVAFWSFKLFTSRWFEIFIVGVILFNAILLAMQYVGAEQTYLDTLNILNNLCLAIFAAEQLLKIIGLGPRQYWEDVWNRFDFAIVVITGVHIIVILLSLTRSC
jgi:hypothetical protein